jgi:hypothetical protein
VRIDQERQRKADPERRAVAVLPAVQADDEEAPGERAGANQVITSHQAVHRVGFRLGFRHGFRA